MPDSLATAAIGTVLTLLAQPVLAQIVPDSTLPQDSVVIPEGDRWLIEGGTTAGHNLFHSFEAFSIPSGQAAHFNNALTIQTILTRVTGEGTSNIDGILSANGTADLFLINPNGLVFGPGAQLQLGGSLLASTGSSIQFADGRVFSTLQPEVPLFSMSVPTGVQLGIAPGPIQVGSDAQQGGPTLEVDPGRFLALLGGNLNLTNAELITDRGGLWLGSATGLVGLSLNGTQLNLSFDEIQRFGDIQLRDETTLIAEGPGSRLQIQGRQVAIQEGSQALLSDGDPAGITLNATESIDISGRSADGSTTSGVASIVTGEHGRGNGGDIKVNTARLRLEEGHIAAFTQDAGNGGNVTIRATDTVEVEGAGVGANQALLNQVLSGQTVGVEGIQSGLFAVSFGSGSAGILMIETPQFLASNGGLAAAVTEGTGDAGGLIINSRDEVFLESSSLVTGAFRSKGAGDAGDLNITAPRVVIQDNSLVVATTLGSGAGGDIVIDAAEEVTLLATSNDIAFPPEINSNTIFGTGQGGNIHIMAPTLKVDQGQIRSRSGGVHQATTLGLPPAAGLVAIPLGGQPGRIVLDITDTLEVVGASRAIDGSLNIDASSFTAFEPGVIDIAAPHIILRDSGGISADARGQSRQGGTINVESDLLLLVDEGGIRTESSGNELEQGGHINVNTSILLALGNSDISADALGTGPGGSIRITADSVIGATVQDVRTTGSDITAVSVVSPDLYGQVILDSLNTDVIIERPEVANHRFVESSPIATGCSAASENRFVVTGRGGLPDSPDNSLEESRPWQDLRLPELMTSFPTEITETVDGTAALPMEIAASAPLGELPGVGPPLVEATGWVIDEQGAVQFISETDSEPVFIVSCGMRS